MEVRATYKIYLSNIYTKSSIFNVLRLSQFVLKLLKQPLSMQLFVDAHPLFLWRFDQPYNSLIQVLSKYLTYSPFPLLIHSIEINFHDLY